MAISTEQLEWVRKTFRTNHLVVLLNVSPTTAKKWLKGDRGMSDFMFDKLVKSFTDGTKKHVKCCRKTVRKVTE